MKKKKGLPWPRTTPCSVSPGSSLTASEDFPAKVMAVSCVGRAPGERCGGGSGGGAPCSQLSRGREELAESSLTEGLVGREGGRLRRNGRNGRKGTIR